MNLNIVWNKVNGDWMGTHSGFQMLISFKEAEQILLKAIVTRLELMYTEFKTLVKP